MALQPVIILYPSATCMSIALRCALLSCTRQHQRCWHTVLYSRCVLCITCAPMLQVRLMGAFDGWSRGVTLSSSSDASDSVFHRFDGMLLARKVTEQHAMRMQAGQ